MDHFTYLEKKTQEGLIPKQLSEIVRSFYDSYGEAVEENGYQISDLSSTLNKFLDLVIEQLKTPFVFEPYHRYISSPFDYYSFGLELLRPMIDFPHSKVLGLDHFRSIQNALKNGDNVILLANHQTEPDPQAISLLLEPHDPEFAKEMIFVAGHRVTSDPLAAPFSKGRNLLCIFSKRHIETHPETKEEKLLHNQRTMKKMSQLLSEGGKCIYVAPSGGRDRIGASGEIEIAPFDPQSIEMFYLMAKQAEHPTHFYTLALATYKMLPPPSSVEKELGEKRQAHCTPIHLAFGPEIEMDKFPGSDEGDKKLRRQKRADFIQQQVMVDYKRLLDHI